MLEELQIDNQRMEQASPHLNLMFQTAPLDKSNFSPSVSNQFRRLQAELWVFILILCVPVEFLVSIATNGIWKKF